MANAQLTFRMELVSRRSEPSARASHVRGRPHARRPETRARRCFSSRALISKMSVTRRIDGSDG